MKQSSQRPLGPADANSVPCIAEPHQFGNCLDWTDNQYPELRSMSCGYGPAEAHGRSRPLTRTQRARIKQQYGSPGADERVLRMLEQLESVEADLSRALQCIVEMEARLVRRSRTSRA